MSRQTELRKSLIALIKEAAVRATKSSGIKSTLEKAELMGSRGRARKYGRPEPEDRDHDYVVFSDDAAEQAKYLKLLRQLGTAGYKLHDRPGGFLTASGNNTDLSVYPTSKRDDIHKAWELIEGGMSKDDAWEQVGKQANANLVASCCGKPLGDDIKTCCPGCPGGMVLRAPQEKQSARVEELLGAKEESDRKNYAAKHDILRKLIKKSPSEFKIDSEEGGIYGITHIPSGFKIHIPKAAAPAELQRANENSYLSTLAPKWLDKSHIVAALRDHLTDASGALDTDLEAKEIADLALITDAYRRAHVSQELMDKRKAKFEEYAASPSMGTVDDVYVQSAVPAASRDLVKKHGLLSSQALVNNPEALEAFLGDRAGTDWEEDEEGFKQRVEEKLKDTFWGDSMKGPSVLFGEPDSEKITDVHPMRKLKSEMLRINLSKLLRDHPKTRIAGSELQPYDPEGPEHQGDLRHYDIDLDKVREYAAMTPEELWKHYDEPEGARYASNVPHAQIITPSGGIPSEYLDFGEKKAEDEESWYVSASDKDGKGLFAEKDFEAGETIFHAGDLDKNKYGLDDWEMTEAAMACNHGRDPNAIVVRDGEELSAVAKEPIKADDEVSVSYFQVTHVIGPGSRLTHNNKPIPPTPAEEMAKWARDERMDWVGFVHGHAGN